MIIIESSFRDPAETAKLAAVSFCSFFPFPPLRLFRQEKAAFAGFSIGSARPGNLVAARTASLGFRPSGNLPRRNSNLKSAKFAS
jgi:hypothetical protein